MNALNRAFIKAYRAPRDPQSTGNATAEVTETTSLGGMLYTSETWEVHAAESPAPTDLGMGVDEVTPEAPARATIVRVDEPHEAAASTGARRSVRSPHWVFVPMTRREKPATTTAREPMPAAPQPVAPEQAVGDTSAASAPAEDLGQVRFLEPAPSTPAALSEKVVEDPTEAIVAKTTLAPETEPERVAEKPAAVIESRKPWLRPALEVDHFRWPAACECLIAFTGQQLDRCVTKVINTARAGRRVIMVSSHARGEGRTTFLLSLARRLSVAGVKTAIVDADFANPQLARRLGLVPDAGWEDALTGRMALSEVMIDSLEDKLSLVPAVGRLRNTDQIKPHAWSESLDALRSHYQVVLVDGPPANDFLSLDSEEIAGIDATVMMQYGDDTHAATSDLARRFRQRGIGPLGLIQNFVREQ